MLMKSFVLILIALPSVAAAATKPVPHSCDATVNADLASFVSSNQGTSQSAHQDNIMVCGTLRQDAFPQPAGRNGGHQALILTIPTNNGDMVVAVITNDHLDGLVTGSAGDQVFAYGQAYFDPGNMMEQGIPISGGLHEPHCATHTGADDGWVVVNGHKYPENSCNQHPRRQNSR
jgi:hypothetical protein